MPSDRAFWRGGIGEGAGVGGEAEGEVGAFLVGNAWWTLPWVTFHTAMRVGVSSSQ